MSLIDFNLNNNKHRSILITGIAGTGKTSICQELNKRAYQAFSIEDLPGIYTRIDKRNGQVFENYDANDLESVQQSSWICNQDKLVDFMDQHQKGIVFYGGVASNLDDIRPLFDIVFMLEADINVLRQRLNKRHSSDFAHSPLVQEWLFAHKNDWENHMRKGAIVINDNENLTEVVDKIIEQTQKII